MDEYLLTRYSKYNMCNFSSIAMQLSYTYSVYIAMLLVARNEKQGMYWLCSFVGFLPAQSTLFKIGYEWFRLTVGSLFFLAIFALFAAGSGSLVSVVHAASPLGSRWF